MANYVTQLKDLEGNNLYPFISKDSFSDVIPASKGGTGATDFTNAAKNLIVNSLAGGTQIPENSDLNTAAYTACGNYFQSTDAKVQTLSNVPTGIGFRMEVKSNSGSVGTLASGTWLHRIREITDREGNSWIQTVAVGSTSGNIVYGDWQQKLTSANGALISKLLWSNSSPTSSFGAQTVTLTDTSYNIVVIHFRWSTSDTGGGAPLVCIKNAGENGAASYETNRVQRYATYNSVGTVTFSAGLYNGSSNNSYCIPTHIWGI